MLIRRRLIAAGLVAAAVAGGVMFLNREDPPPKPWQIRGSNAWARKYYGNANAPKFRDRNVTEINFLGEPMYVHEDAAPSPTEDLCTPVRHAC